MSLKAAPDAENGGGRGNKPRPPDFASPNHDPIVITTIDGRTLSVVTASLSRHDPVLAAATGRRRPHRHYAGRPRYNRRRRRKVAGRRLWVRPLWCWRRRQEPSYRPAWSIFAERRSGC